MWVSVVGFQFHTPSKKQNILSENKILGKKHVLTKNTIFWNFQKVYIRLQGWNISIIKSFLEWNATVNGDKRIKKTL